MLKNKKYNYETKLRKARVKIPHWSATVKVGMLILVASWSFSLSPRCNLETGDLGRWEI